VGAAVYAVAIPSTTSACADAARRCLCRAPETGLSSSGVRSVLGLGRRSIHARLGTRRIHVGLPRVADEAARTEHARGDGRTLSHRGRIQPAKPEHQRPRRPRRLFSCHAPSRSRPVTAATGGTGVAVHLFPSLAAPDVASRRTERRRAASHALRFVQNQTAILRLWRGANRARFSRSRGITPQTKSTRAPAASASANDDTSAAFAALLTQHRAVQPTTRSQEGPLAAEERRGIIPDRWWWPGSRGELGARERDVPDAHVRGKLGAGGRRAVILDPAPRAGAALCASSCPGTIRADRGALGFIALVGPPAVSQGDDDDALRPGAHVGSTAPPPPSAEPNAAPPGSIWRKRAQALAAVVGGKTSRWWWSSGISSHATGR